jgi:hypothetical protein
MPRRVIIDTDPGIDDTIALLCRRAAVNGIAAPKSSPSSRLTRRAVLGGRRL